MSDHRDPDVRLRTSAHRPPLVGAADVLRCLDAGIPAGAAAALCGLKLRDRQRPKEAPDRPVAAPVERPPSPEPPPAAGELRLPLAVEATLDPAGFDRPTAEADPDRQDPFDEDDLRVAGGTLPTAPLMPWSRLWPFLHRVLGLRRPGTRLDIPRVVRLAASGRLLARLPVHPVQRWAPRVRIIVDRTLPVGFVDDDCAYVVEQLRILRGAQGLDLCQVVSHLPSTAPDLFDLEELDKLPIEPVPTVVLGDLGQLRADPTVMDRWIAVGKKLRRVGVAPVALVPCPPERWFPSMTTVWRCACWDRHANPWRRPTVATAPSSATDALSEAARRAHQLLGLLAATLLVEPPLLRDLRCLLPPTEADVGSEYDLRVGAATGVAGRDLALLPTTRSPAAGYFPKEPRLRAAVVEAMVRHHHVHSPALWSQELLDLADLGAPVPPEKLQWAERVQKRLTATQLRDMDDDETASLLGVFPWRDWVTSRLSAAARGRSEIAYGYALAERRRLGAGAAIAVPEGMDPDHVRQALRMTAPAPDRVTRWSACLQGGYLDLRPWPGPGAGTPAGLSAGFPLAQVQVRRPHLTLTVHRKEAGTSRVLPLGSDGATAAVGGAFRRVELRGDCGSVSVEPRTTPVAAVVYGWDRRGAYAEFDVAEVRFRLRWVPPGSFLMGSPEDEPGRLEREGPRHRVVIPRGFWMSQTPVTQQQYEAVTGENPSRFKGAGPEAPVEQVDWDDAQLYCMRLGSAVTGLPEGWAFQLPSEAQWEYACRAGTDTALYTGPITLLGQNNAPELEDIAWYGGNSGVEYEGGYDSSGWPEKSHDHNQAGTQPVGLKKENALGLHDMLGNVWEWCEDDWHGDYKNAPADGRAWVDGLPRGAIRVVRGGSWFGVARRCRCACRIRIGPGGRVDSLGFRLVVAPSSTKSK